jgi:hypothetical protein
VLRVVRTPNITHPEQNVAARTQPQATLVMELIGREQQNDGSCQPGP